MLMDLDTESEKRQKAKQNSDESHQSRVWVCVSMKVEPFHIFFPFTALRWSEMFNKTKQKSCKIW